MTFSVKNIFVQKNGVVFDLLSSIEMVVGLQRNMGAAAVQVYSDLINSFEFELKFEIQQLTLCAQITLYSETFLNVESANYTCLKCATKYLIY